MMAAVDYNEVVQLCQSNNSSISINSIIKIIPLTSVEQRVGPILFHPSHPQLQSFISIIGTPIPCSSEEELKPLISITGQISAFYELLNTTQHWVEQQGLPTKESRLFISSFYSSLAVTTINSNKEFSRKFLKKILFFFFYN